MESLQDLVDLAVRKCGGQSELAREIKRRFGVVVRPQNIEWLRQRTRKPAQRSSLTPYIATIAGVDPAWAPKPNLKGVASRTKEPLRVARTVAVKIKETGKVVKVELTTEVLRVAKALMDMDADDRLEVVAKVEALEIQRRALKGRHRGPDRELDHMARPDTPEGKELRRSATKKKGVSRHSQ